MQRNSKQRELILKILRNTTSHPTASWIYEEARKELPNISLGTVYRNLVNLYQSGEIVKVTTSENSEHFDGDTSGHNHFQCEHCKSILDIFDVNTNGLDLEVGDKLKCKVKSHNIVFYGVCENCLAKPL